ncbi:hypothetical protein D3C77_369450 [compost metagenome]
MLVTFLRLAGNGLAVAGQRFVGIIRNAYLQHCWIEHTNQCVTALDMGIKKTQRFAWFQGLQPQCGLAQLDSHRIEINTMDAVLHYLAQRMTELLFRVLITLSIQLSYFRGQTACSCKQEMAASARGITHLDR